jgi:NAD(P)-dependent dehydrogenase (short-subunit alcohol dehydrogenase family)
MHGKEVALVTGGRLGTWAAAVCFIASLLSDFMTGSTFRIDGGATPTI